MVEENKVQTPLKRAQTNKKHTRNVSMVDQVYNPTNPSPNLAASTAAANPNRSSQQFSGGVGTQSMMMPSADRPSMNPLRKSHNSNRLLDQPSLPQTFDMRAVRELDAEACMLCEAPFTGKLTVINRNVQKNCKRCGRAICDTCSDQKR